MSVKLPAEITSVYTIAPASVHELAHAAVMIGYNEDQKFLLILAPTARMLPDGFEGETVQLNDRVMLRCPCTPANAAALRQHFPWIKPECLPPDRSAVCTGTAAAGQFQLFPIPARQTKTESNSGKSFQDTVSEALFQVFETNCRTGWGAEAARLQTMEDIDAAIGAGMTIFSLDFAAVMNTASNPGDDHAVNAAFEALDSALRSRIESEYAGQSFINGDCAVEIDRQAARRCTVMYAEAIDFTEKVRSHLAKRCGEDFSLEIALDQTAGATSPAQHFFLLRELRRRNISISSLALRYPDHAEDLAQQFRVHARIAEANGNYMLAIPASTDFLAAYSGIAETPGPRLKISCGEDAGKSAEEFLTALQAVRK